MIKEISGRAGEIIQVLRHLPYKMPTLVQSLSTEIEVFSTNSSLFWLHKQKHWYRSSKRIESIPSYKTNVFLHPSARWNKYSFITRCITFVTRCIKMFRKSWGQRDSTESKVFDLQAVVNLGSSPSIIHSIIYGPPESAWSYPWEQSQE